MLEELSGLTWLLQFLNSSQLVSCPNLFASTMLFLIPKVDTPSNARDFRPIACCSTLYKCISKLIYMRLFYVLPCLISENQGAFVKGSSISYNILILQHLLRHSNRRNISARCFMQLDLSKAYDTFFLQFVEDFLNAFSFPTKFIGSIMACLKCTHYTLLLNGNIQGGFKGKKGLRQMDPMSPLLFVLIMEYLTRILIYQSRFNGLCFHPSCKPFQRNSLCFADDLILMCKPISKYFGAMLDGLNMFLNASSLCINKNKSSLYISGVDGYTKLAMI